MDKITLDRIQLLKSIVREEATNIFRNFMRLLKGRAICRFVYTLRTFAEQDALFNQKPKQRSNEKSYHNYD